MCITTFHKITCAPSLPEKEVTIKDFVTRVVSAALLCNSYLTSKFNNDFHLTRKVCGVS